MISAGIDVGAKTIKAALVDDGKVLGTALVPAGFDLKEGVEEAYTKALEAAGVTKDQVGAVVSTGAGSKEVTFATKTVTIVGAAARGAHYHNPEVRTIIDVGAEEGRGIKVSPDGKVVDFVVNEKCAAGAGAFTEAMARALEVTVEEIGQLSLKSQKSVPMNAQCAVFAESEVVSLIHSKTPKEDIARAIHEAIASRIVSMVRRVGLEKEVGLTGGLSRNPGYVDAVQKLLGMELKVLPEPDMVGAIGAAMSA